MRADYQYDWLHPNAAGYKAMGLKAAEVLSPMSKMICDK